VIDYKAVCEDGTEVDSHFDGDMGAKAIAAFDADEKEDANTADSLVLLLLKRERDLLKQENAKLKLDEKKYLGSSETPGCTGNRGPARKISH
jgi:hypothetical protein